MQLSMQSLCQFSQVIHIYSIYVILFQQEESREPAFRFPTQTNISRKYKSDLESVKEPDTHWTDVKRHSMTQTGQEVSRDATGKRRNILLLCQFSTHSKQWLTSDCQCQISFKSLSI